MEPPTVPIESDKGARALYGPPPANRICWPIGWPPVSEHVETGITSLAWHEPFQATPGDRDGPLAASQAAGEDIERGWLGPAESGYGKPHCPPHSKELVMLTLTDSAVSAIRSLTSQPELPVETGLRIMTQDEQDEGAPSFQLALVEGPVAGDQVVEEGGARVFIEVTAAAVLGDKALDAQVNEQGDVAFSVSDQAHRG
jgi:iron-sulfur cluster assembly protein